MDEKERISQYLQILFDFGNNNAMILSGTVFNETFEEVYPRVASFLLQAIGHYVDEIKNVIGEESEEYLMALDSQRRAEEAAMKNMPAGFDLQSLYTMDVSFITRQEVPFNTGFDIEHPYWFNHSQPFQHPLYNAIQDWANSNRMQRNDLVKGNWMMTKYTQYIITDGDYMSRDSHSADEVFTPFWIENLGHHNPQAPKGKPEPKKRIKGREKNTSKKSSKFYQRRPFGGHKDNGRS